MKDSDKAFDSLKKNKKEVRKSIENRHSKVDSKIEATVRRIEDNTSKDNTSELDEMLKELENL
jgi:hypothetical protein